MNNYEKLKKIYDQIDKLLNDNSTAYTKDFLAWHQECKRFLTNTYGADSMELKNFLSTRFETAIINKEQEIWACKNGLEIVKTTFETLLNELSEEISSNNELNISDNKNIELTIDQIFRLNFDCQNQSVTVRPFSDTSYFHCKIIPKRITYSAVLKLLDKNFDDISEDDIVEIHE